jgi:hypothetical protein
VFGTADLLFRQPPGQAFARGQVGRMVATHRPMD